MAVSTAEELAAVSRRLNGLVCGFSRQLLIFSVDSSYDDVVWRIWWQ